MASGGRHGFAQSLFQVGGNTGSAIGPLLAAFVVVPRGQGSVAWFSAAALAGMVILERVGRWYQAHREGARVAGHGRRRPSRPAPRQVVVALAILLVLVFSKNVYLASISSYYTFYPHREVRRLGAGRPGATCSSSSAPSRRERSSAAPWATGSAGSG